MVTILEHFNLSEEIKITELQGCSNEKYTGYIFDKLPYKESRKQIIIRNNTPNNTPLDVSMVIFYENKATDTVCCRNLLFCSVPHNSENTLQIPKYNTKNTYFLMLLFNLDKDFFISQLMFKHKSLLGKSLYFAEGNKEIAITFPSTSFTTRLDCIILNEEIPKCSIYMLTKLSKNKNLYLSNIDYCDDMLLKECMIRLFNKMESNTRSVITITELINKLGNMYNNCLENATEVYNKIIQL